MKCFRESRFAFHVSRFALASGLALAVVSAVSAAVQWQHLASGSAMEAALYRWMPMPVTKVLGLRPPREAVPLLGDLIRQQPTAELHSLRALNEEAALDFTAAEADWKKYAATASDRTAAQFAVADFYHRRLRPADEIAALNIAARAPDRDNEKLVASEQQRSWEAFERIFKVISENALPADLAAQEYQAWVARYPQQSSAYGRYFQFLLEQRRFGEADKLIAQYQKAVPRDDVFPVKARALLAYRQGSVEKGLGVYEAQFQPLWPPELVQSYFELLTETQSLRRFLDQARTALERNPDDLNAAAWIFYYYQRQGRTDAAQQLLIGYRTRKERRNAKWTPQELYTLARLNESVHAYPEAARYYYALYSTGPEQQEQALAGLTNLLLEAPEQGIRLGSSDLSMYRDIATMDTGPGLLNGILSLVLNTTSPAYHYSEEEQRAIPYFHRAQAAELLRLFDARFPNAGRRAALHARLMETYAAYGEADAVIRGGRQFLAEFPSAPEREKVALLMADAYARQNREQEEFALYDSLLAELGKKAEGVPLGSATTGAPQPQPAAVAEEEPAEQEGEDATAQQRRPAKRPPRAFSIKSEKKATVTAGERSPEYARVLERYLSRLVALGRLPDALAVLRREIDRNPKDPGLYERLAQLLEQNRLGEQQEQVYQRAIQMFPDRSWYHKLARFYLRQKRNADFARFSEQVINIFSGTELEHYFTDVGTGGDYYVRLNEFAHQRFPHDLMFVRNLLRGYQQTRGPWEQLLREHWWEAEDLRNRFFEHLSRTGRLQNELAELNQTDPAAPRGQWEELAKTNPVAARFVAEAGFWRSHYEEAAPAMGAVAQQFPADGDVGRRAAAAYRSLAAFDSANTQRAVAVQENLYRADPTNREALAAIGDTYADREQFQRAASYWDRMAQVRPGEPQAYLDAATVYWDYYDFDNALRLLNEGRAKLGNAALYSYEEGAIYEGKRDYPAAIAEYVRGALHETEGSRARNRLLDLARRPKLRDLVDRATQPLGESANADAGAINLRIAVLQAENRPKDVESYLLAVTSRATSREVLEWLEEIARQKSLVSLQEKALERQAAVTTDPVHRMEIRYALVRFYEAQKQTAAAERTIEALYRDHPKALGVVRSTVDFYWRNKEARQAIAVLIQAASRAYPELSAQLRFEAARKATEAGEYDEARRLLADLLEGAPYRDEYLAAMADAYARAGDDQALRGFYETKIDELSKAPLPPEVRTRQVAALRRGLIPALTRLKLFSDAVEQYIQIINRYPEDESVAAEAALYAQQHGRPQQLIDLYREAARQAPRDYRWPMVLARVQTQLEDYSAAIDAYGAAMTIRPDRVDLRTARAELLERLMRFDEAATDYQRLFDLNYHNPQWMEKLALVRARQGKAPEAVAALEKVFLENRPEKPANYFAVAQRLESWGMLPQARDYAVKGVEAAGRDLLAVTDNHAGAELYARILTRLRQYETAYQRLEQARADATSMSSSAAVAVTQLEKQGIAAITDQQWRDHAMNVRRETARTGMAAALRSMARAVADYYTPEEKLAFAELLKTKAASASNDELATVFLPAAELAGLEDQRALWLERLLLANYQGGRYKSQLIDLQTRRLRFQELGSQLERFAQSVPAGNLGLRDTALIEAAKAYRQGGLYEQELNTLAKVGRRLKGNDEQRYFGLLLQRRPAQLLELAGSTAEQRADAAAQYVVLHGTPQLALAAVAARGRASQPVWTNAYTALSGLYQSAKSPAVKTAFETVLGDATVGERIGTRVDRTRRLAGDVWFYYGSRYGEYLGMTSSSDAGDFLPAILEQSPASVSGYITVAEYYTDAGKVDASIQDYSHALELAPSRPDLHDRIALLYWRQGKRSEAVAEWKQALELLQAQINQRKVPAEFWPTLTSVLNHVGSRRLLAEVRPQANAVLRDYVHHNGAYQADEILRAAFGAAGDPQQGVAWLLQLSAVAPNAETFLRFVESDWIPASARGPLYERLIDLLQNSARSAEGMNREYAGQELRRWQLTYVRYLLDRHDVDRAAALLQSLPKNQAVSDDEIELQLRIAAERHQLELVLQGYRSAPDQAPSPETLRRVAGMLRQAELRMAARQVLEYAYSQEIAAHQLTASNLLGLAEIRLEGGDLSGTMQLLRRLALVVGQPFENLDAAASLLARTGHHAEAAIFLAQRVQAVPWDTRARLKLAEEQLAVGHNADAAPAVVALARDSSALYADRVAAAKQVHGADHSLGSAELDILSGMTPPTPAAADRPYFYAARLRAADAAPAQRAELLRAALSDHPDGEAARITLFKTLVAAGRNQLAVSTLEPLLRSPNFLPQRYYSAWREQRDRDFDTVGAALAVTEEGEVSEEQSQLEEQVKGMSRQQRSALAVTLAKCYANLGETDEALRYYQTAAALAPTKAAGGSIEKEIARLRDAARRNALNLQRAPTIRRDLDQENIVRPRLAETAAAPARPAKGGPAQ